MAAPFRIFLIFIAVVLMLLGAVVAAILSIDVEDYRDDIVRSVNESTGLDLRLQGPLELSLFPELSLEVTDAAADWDDADAAPLVAIRRVHFALPVMPLLTGEGLRVEAVVLDGVSLDLRVDAGGRDNWSPPDDAPSNDPDPDATDTVDVDPDPSDESDAGAEGVETDLDLKLALERLEITDLRVRYRDARDDTDIDLSGLDVVGTSTDGEFDVDIGGRLDMVGGPHIAFDGDLRGDEDLQRVEIRELVADVELPDWARPLPIRLTGAASGDERSVELQGLRLAIGELVLEANGTVGVEEGGEIAVDLEILPSDLRTLLARSGSAPATADPAALTALSGSVDVRGTADALRFEAISLNLDDLALTGSAAVTDGDRTAVRFDLDAGRLDLTPYIGPEDENAPEPEAGPLVTEDPLELDALTSIDVDGRLAADAIVLPNLAIGAARVEVDVVRGRADIDVNAEEVLGGAIEAAIDLDVERDAPEFGLRLAARNLDGGRVAPEAGFSGPLSVDGRLDASGVSTAALARDLRGRFDLGGEPGVLNVAGLRNALLPLAVILGERDRVAAWPDQLGYQSLTGAWIVADGTGDQRITLAVDNLGLQADGGVDLGSGDFDFRADALFSDVTPRTFDVPRDLDGIELPARCTGTLGDEGNPCGFDQEATGDLIRQVAAGRAGEELRERITDQVPDELRGAADLLLRNLFGQPPREERPADPPDPRR